MPPPRKRSRNATATMAVKRLNTGCSASMPEKRPLKAVAAEYAAELLRRTPLPSPMTKSEHVLEVLSRQHGRAYPVASNGGTRPTICGAMAEAMCPRHNSKKCKGPECIYERLCVSGSDPTPTVPELLVLGSADPSEPDLLLHDRFPTDASTLLRDGAQRITLLGEDEVASVIREVVGHDYGRVKSLTVSQGNGRNGRYATLSNPLPPTLRAVAVAVKAWIEAHAGPLKTPLGKKTLLLRYGLGGVNFAHHDSCGDFQALLMLSVPAVDFAGGDFYLADGNPPFALRAFPFGAAGELLVFRGTSNRGHGTVDYLHGMTEVTPGTGEGETRRFAVGFFQ